MKGLLEQSAAHLEDEDDQLPAMDEQPGPSGAALARATPAGQNAEDRPKKQSKRALADDKVGQAKEKNLWAFQQPSREPPKAAAWSCRLDSTVAATKLQRSIHSGICCSACSSAILPSAALQQQCSVVCTSSADLCSHRSRV